MLNIQKWTKNYIKQGSELERSDWRKVSQKTVRKTYLFAGLGALAFVIISLVVSLTGFDIEVGGWIGSLVFFVGMVPCLIVTFINARVIVLRNQKDLTEYVKVMLATPASSEQANKEALGAFKHAAKKTLATMDSKRAATKYIYDDSVYLLKSNIFLPIFILAVDAIAFIATGNLSGLSIAATIFVFVAFASDLVFFLRAKNSYEERMAWIQDEENQALNRAREVLNKRHEEREKAAASVVYPD
jgi:hypothetical protein